MIADIEAPISVLFSELLRKVRRRNGSDIHLIAGLPPAFRVGGEILVSDMAPLSGDRLLELTRFLLTEEQFERVRETREICLSYFDQQCGRLRIAVYHRLGIPELAIRLCNLEVLPADQLGLPKVVEDLAQRTSGLVLVTGPTGVGKTTTLNYMVDLINASRRCKILTIEDPVEFEHHHRKSIVVQIEVGTDTNSFSSCLRHALRMDPDVICVGEMRDLDTIDTALTAAETGHLVLATLHTPSAPGTIERIVGVFDGNRQNQARLQLASVLQGVISQRLVPTLDRKHRVLACEVMLASRAVRHHIRENAVNQLRNDIYSARQDGMQTLEESLSAHYRAGRISYDEAMRWANEPNEIEALSQGRA